MITTRVEFARALEPKVAFELLVEFFEADAAVMENSAEHHWGMQCAFKRAADGYGVRGVLATMTDP